MTRKRKEKSAPASPEESFPIGISSRDFLKKYGASFAAAYNDSENDAAEDKSKDSADAKSKKKGKNKNVGSEPGDRGKAVGLRVIGGKFRALRLKYGGDHRVRPMKDRIRESVFNLLGPVADGKYVIDLFAGTGALTFEALSRGAQGALMIEVHFPTARVIRDNIALIEFKEPGISDRITLKTTDVFFWGRNLAKETAAKQRGEEDSIPADRRINLPTDLPWLVFCSPPYSFYVSRQEEMLMLLDALREAAPEGSIFVIEADDRFDFDLLNAEIPPKKRRSYPPAEVGIFTK